MSRQSDDPQGDAKASKTAVDDARDAAVAAARLWYDSLGRALYEWVLRQGDEFVARQPEVSERLGARELKGFLELVRAGAIGVRAMTNTSASSDVRKALEADAPAAQLALSVGQLRDMAEAGLRSGLREAGYTSAAGQTWTWYGENGEPGSGCDAASLDRTPEAQRLVDLVVRAKHAQDAHTPTEAGGREGDTEAVTPSRRGRKHWAPTDRITLDLWEPTAIVLMSWLEATDERMLTYDHPAQKQALRDLYFALDGLGYDPEELAAANRQVSQHMSFEDRGEPGPT